MNHIPEYYANKPNLWRIACELSKFKDPYKAADILLSLAIQKQQEDTRV